MSGVRSGKPDTHLLCPDLEARQRVGAKRVADRDIGGIAISRDQHAANTRHVVPSVKGVPATAKVCLESGGEVHWAVWGQYADVTQVAGAVACRNVHAVAERDREVRVITADAGPLIESLPGRPCGAGVLVTKGDMLMDEIADGLDASPSSGRFAEEVPSRLGQPIGFAISASQEKNQGLLGQILHWVLLGRGGDDICLARIVHDRIG